MRLLYICHAYPPHGGGVGSFVQTIGRGMVRKGHEVYVAEPWTPQRRHLPAYECDEGVHVYRMGVRWYTDRLWDSKSAAARLLYRFMQRTKINFLLFLLRSRINARYIAAFIAAHKIDIAEVPDGNEGGLLGANPGKAVLLVRLHGSATLMDHAGVRANGIIETSIYKRIEARLLQRADAMVAVSKFTAALVQKIFKTKTAAIPVVYNVVEQPKLTHAVTAPPYILFAGSISWNKGVVTLAKAWNIVAKALPGVKLIVLGDGDANLLWDNIHPSCHAQVAAMGSVSREEVQQYMAGAACFVLPSYYESFSIAVEEAMALGCPVIYTERCSGPEIIDHGTDGILVNPDDANELAKWIKKILEDNEFAARLGEAARRKAVRFTDVAAWLQENETIYVNLLEKHTAHG
ncbi:glycosyltransferase family 4 protein [Chitinophagaceae bacterium MMS25-I14]